jgi:enoyl-CoA hydratase/carnithine racemase
MFTSSSAPLRVTRELPGLWRATIDNPPLNLLDAALMEALQGLINDIEQDDQVRVLLFDSADPDYFLAHFDVLNDPAPFLSRRPSGVDPWPDFTTRLNRAPVLSIASVRGRARGVGSEFLLACDMRVASLERAVLGQPEVGLGLMAGGGALERLPALVGRDRALEITLGGQDFDAATAERYGYVNRALPDAELDDWVDRLARRIAGFDRRSVAVTKRIINERAGLAAPADLQASQDVFFETAAWPETQAKIQKATAAGLQRRGDLEHRLGDHLESLSATD